VEASAARAFTAKKNKKASGSLSDSPTSGIRLASTGRRYPAALKRSLDPSVSQRSGPVETCQGTDVFLDIYR
jgi:hypothetical protein